VKIVLVEEAGTGKLAHYTYGLASALSKENEVSLFTSKEYELSDLPRRFQLKESSLQSLLEERTDVIHFQWTKSPEATLSLLPGLKEKARIVYTPHSILPHKQRESHIPIFEKIYRLVDRIIVHSEEEKEELAGLFGNKEKTVVLPHGDYSFLHKLYSLKRQPAKAMLGINSRDKIILFFGYVKKEKGIETLLQAFSKVREEAAGIEEVKLIIAGEGDMAHSQDEGLIRDLRYVPLDKAALYFSAADVVVLPYQKRANSPIVQLAYTFGRPVITTSANNGVIDGKTGFIVQRGDSDELAGKIIEIILCSSRAFRMSQYARRLSQTKYSWERIARETVEVYR